MDDGVEFLSSVFFDIPLGREFGDFMGNGSWRGGVGIYYCDNLMLCSITKRQKTRLPAVCTAVTGVLVGVALVVLCCPNVEGRLKSGSVWLALVLSAVSFASPLSSFKEGASAGKGNWLLSEPPLFNGTWVVRESVVGDTFASPLVQSCGNFFWGTDMWSVGVVGENVVRGDVAAAVAVVAMSE